jgi:hypothetical protein
LSDDYGHPSSEPDTVLAKDRIELEGQKLGGLEEEAIPLPQSRR